MREGADAEKRESERERERGGADEEVCKIEDEEYDVREGEGMKSVREAGKNEA